MLETMHRLLYGSLNFVLPGLIVVTAVAAALYAYLHREEVWVRQYIGRKVMVPCYLIAMVVTAGYYLAASNPPLATRQVFATGLTVGPVAAHLLHIMTAYVVCKICLIAADHLPEDGATRYDKIPARLLRATPRLLVAAFVAASVVLLVAPGDSIDPKFDASPFGHAYRILVGVPCIFSLTIVVWLLIVARSKGRRTSPADRVAHARYGWFAAAEAAFALLWLNLLLWPLAAGLFPSVAGSDVVALSRVSEIPILLVMGVAKLRGLTLPPDQGTPETVLNDHARFEELLEAVGVKTRRFDAAPPHHAKEWAVGNLVLKRCIDELLHPYPVTKAFHLRLARRTMSLLALVSPPEDPDGAWRENVAELARLRDDLSRNDPDDALLIALDTAIELTDEKAVRPLAHEPPWLQATALAAANEGLLPEPWRTPIAERHALRPTIHHEYDFAETATKTRANP